MKLPKIKRPMQRIVIEYIRVVDGIPSPRIERSIVYDTTAERALAAERRNFGPPHFINLWAYEEDA